jgi:hypothetical protein
MKKKIYLSGWEVQLNNDISCEHFLATHITYKQTAIELGVFIELIFEEGKLIKAHTYWGDEKQERPIEEDEINFSIPKYKRNKTVDFEENEFGLNHLGGEMPIDFNNCVVPFQYLGFFDNKDKQFNWLPFKLHLVCPIFLNFDKVFLDYSNPNYPILINREEIEDLETNEDNLDKETEIIYEELRFNSSDTEPYIGEIISGGIPGWIQYPDIPICPKSNKMMKFLCQMSSNEVLVKRSNVVPSKNEYCRSHKFLHFWGDGNLYVFFEPSSKVACFIIQHT